MNSGMTAKILEKLSEGAMVSAALFRTILESGYGASYSKLQRNFDKIINEPRGGRFSEAERKKHNFYLILSKLKREGLVKKKENKWSITSAGKERLSKLLKRLPRHRYNKEADSTVKIVIFDIPEKEQRKRAWLRRRLQELGFKMLQKSVWMGKVKLPEEFLEDLRGYEVFPYVDIFAVTKSGSVRIVD
ncbi:MAG: CRISPR-associated endonuclease Cas2 [Candidatus Colwellbacteria bacterium CG23_combo_of_CG06-09_8_20_14_all_42_19]|uniref:CRISPR-associated endonuclease Cas2 n=1 Tax=Candidatus Colwellbacteria bacterium CG23_combo_of_CG06-09_8_20_14_all_42_19 TaxID=1974541 RepID=A0A2H0AMJ7_9BACT|nr:MAG: CRISPR-associated endonuclease Cas2 [Candidatus Colwellbacteria bacterium CG23_combo_of_CG06-09_8_20_14_all_42_19]